MRLKLIQQDTIGAKDLIILLCFVTNSNIVDVANQIGFLRSPREEYIEAVEYSNPRSLNRLLDMDREDNQEELELARRPQIAIKPSYDQFLADVKSTLLSKARVMHMPLHSSYIVTDTSNYSADGCIYLYTPDVKKWRDKILAYNPANG